MTKMSLSGVKLQGRVTETKVMDKTCDRTTAELMFYHGIACTSNIRHTDQTPNSSSTGYCDDAEVCKAVIDKYAFYSLISSFLILNIKRVYSLTG